MEAGNVELWEATMLILTVRVIQVQDKYGVPSYTVSPGRMKMTAELVQEPQSSSYFACSCRPLCVCGSRP